ncbi:phosphate ABC transporter permease PstA [Halorubrum rubrum]|uniref:Phosphate transport system permease protein PstA n=1 Tax=Halorubrum rubrum TaxID=1126240 RepID=A0ABD5QXE5_9EURY|nr:phosphate ABC transporter permease PstA [Halorubrum rubrum]
MSTATRHSLRSDQSEAFTRLTDGVVGVGITVISLSVLAVGRVVTGDTAAFGLGAFEWIALALAAMGSTVVALGVGSFVGTFETNPEERGTVGPALGFGGIAFAAGGLTASQTLGLPLVASLAAALVAGLAVGGFVTLAREDLGTTLPAGGFALFVGALVLTDVLAAGWTWAPEGFSVTFPGYMVVPVLAGLAALVACWAAVSARSGFGAAGRQSAAYFLVGLNAIGMLVVLATLILFIGVKGFGRATQGIAFDPLALEFRWPFVMDGYNFRPDQPNGVFPAVVGTVWLVIGAVLVGVPLAVGAAVFLSEYAERGRFTQLVEVATNGLWSTPSVVFGLFGYAFLVPRFGNTTSLLAGMMVLGFMLLPLVTITSREAIKAVPDEYRDASAALGVSQWETIRSVVVPTALPGIVTGVILGVGRIAGETAPILLVMAGGLRDDAPSVLGSFQFVARPPFVVNDALLQSAPALPYQLYATITAGVSGNEEFGWATAFVLLAVVLSFYAIGVGTRIYFRRRLQHE